MLAHNSAQLPYESHAATVTEPVAAAAKIFAVPFKSQCQTYEFVLWMKRRSPNLLSG